VGEAFVIHTAYIKMYSLYINNFDSACTELERLVAKKKKFKAFCLVYALSAMGVVA
jgi:hypothetical protein